MRFFVWFHGVFDSANDWAFHYLDIVFNAHGACAFNCIKRKRKRT